MVTGSEGSVPDVITWVATRGQVVMECGQRPLVVGLVITQLVMAANPLTVTSATVTWGGGGGSRFRQKGYALMDNFSNQYFIKTCDFF